MSSAPNRRRRIAVVTTGRADYGHLYWLIQDLKNDSSVELQTVVAGMHLSEKFGNTWREVETDGAPLSAKVPLPLEDDSPAGTSRAIAEAIVGFTKVFGELKPDLVVILGDRYEVLGAATAAMVSRIPIAHLHGGELSEGAIDDAIRHAITKMASLHFTAAASYRQRVLQMGEAPDRVFDFGAPGLDHAKRSTLGDRGSVETRLGKKLGSPFFLVTYHPATLGDLLPETAAGELVAALEKFPSASVVITIPNADPGNAGILRVLEKYGAGRADRVTLVSALGSRGYLSALRACDVVIGNSSSGLIEAPFFRKATVNLGPRQNGRLKAKSVVDCEESAPAIVRAITQALSPEFQNRLLNVESLYGSGDASSRLAKVLAEFPLEKLKTKHFRDQ